MNDKSGVVQFCTTPVSLSKTVSLRVSAHTGVAISGFSNFFYLKTVFLLLFRGSPHTSLLAGSR